MPVFISLPFVFVIYTLVSPPRECLDQERSGDASIKCDGDAGRERSAPRPKLDFRESTLFFVCFGSILLVTYRFRLDFIVISNFNLPGLELASGSEWLAQVGMAEPQPNWK